MNGAPPDRPPQGIRVFDRRAGRMVREVVLGDRWLRAAYAPPWRSLCRVLFFRRAWASRLLGRYCDSRLSRWKIPRVMVQLGIDPSEFLEPVESFRTFNEFFTRRLRSDARPFDPAPDVFCSPADSRVRVFPRWAGDERLEVKARAYTNEELLGKPGAAAPFAGGPVVVARLCPADYHRFHYPADGRTIEEWDVPGGFDSVNPLALTLRPQVLAENRRRVSLLDLVNFGRTAFVEVGAFGVGAIVRTHTEREFRKMDEKGYFKFGGSTIVLLFEPGRFEPDPDLTARTREGIETRVRAGERLGRAVLTKSGPGPT
ncbi:MAG: phosphatidylserine decarboxylase [Kiritimatiellaeota bacterium]|nr:phosphatidylserine decarboxylase [Kiritimatiellota bacterium]